MAAILELEHVSKAYPGVIALDDVSMSFEPGEIHSIMGENGAGKSTMIKIIAGAIPSSGGRIIINGNAFEKLNPAISKNNGIGVIYQEFNLVPSMSVAENIFLGEKLGGRFMPNFREMRRKAEEAMADLGVKIAKGASLPSLSLSAGLSTSWNSSTGNTYFDQLGNKLGESLGLSLSLPIFNGKQVRTNVRKAELQLENARLQDESARKQLLATLESLRNDAAAAQQRYFASKLQLEAAAESFRLVTEQFEAGIKNTVELLTEKNNYISALSQQLQAKYQAVLAGKLLARYMNQPIDL